MDDYAAAVTTVTFDRPIPLLRGPIPAAGSDAPELGPYVLAFRSADAWAAAYRRSETLIREQCEEGARIGCAVTASRNCKPPWWRRRSGDIRDREKCEQREFEGCLAAAKEKCVDFAKDKCSGPFLDARIALVSAKEVAGFVWLASMPKDSRWRDLIGFDQLSSWLMGKHRAGVTNCRARDLLNSGRNPESMLG